MYFFKMTATKNFNGGNGSDADTPVLQMIDRTQPAADIGVTKVRTSAYADSARPNARQPWLLILKIVSIKQFPNMV